MKRALVLIAGLTAILPGCGSGRGGIEAGYAAPAGIGGGPSADGGGAPDDPSGAIAFVGGIYQAYLSGKRPDPSRYYSTRLRAAVRHPGGRFNYDPFCLCGKTDEFGYAIQRDDPLPNGGRRVEVEINSGETRQIRAILLVRENRGWRVDNFGEREGAIYKPEGEPKD